RCEADGVNQDVEAAQRLTRAPNETLDVLVVADVALEDGVRVELTGHLPRPPGELFALVAEGEACALAVHGLGNAPGDRAFAGEAGDQRALALQETHRF